MAEDKEKNQLEQRYQAEQRLVTVLYPVGITEKHVYLSLSAREKLDAEFNIEFNKLSDPEKDLLDKVYGLTGQRTQSESQIAEDYGKQRGVIRKKIHEAHNSLRGYGRNVLPKFVPYIEGSLINDAWNVTCDYDVMQIGTGKGERSNEMASAPQSLTVGDVYTENDEVGEIIRAIAINTPLQGNPLEMPVYQFAQLIKTNDIEEKFRSDVLAKLRAILPR